jgi:hypothetical protein
MNYNHRIEEDLLNHQNLAAIMRIINRISGLFHQVFSQLAMQESFVYIDHRTDANASARSEMTILRAHPGGSLVRSSQEQGGPPAK